MIHNVHERVLRAPAVAVGALLETLGSPDDDMWRSRIEPPMVLADGLRPGSRGGHGSIRYRVQEHEPGRRVVFAFEPPTPLVGTHTFDVRSLPDGSSAVRHTLTGHATGWMRLLWPLLVRTLHDCVVEDVLDHLERRLTGAADRVQPVSARARLVTGLQRRPTWRAPVRLDGLLAQALPRVDASDAWSTELDPRDSRDPRAWQRAVLAGGPSWVAALMGVRDAVVRPLGLRTTRSEERSFPVLATSGDEVLLGLDDRHLSFRVSVRVEENAVCVTTLVQRHNLLGDLYWSLVRWFHPVVVRSLLRGAPRPVPAEVRTPSGRTA